MTFLVGPEVAGKQLELLKEVAPAASRVAVLTNSTNRSHATLTGFEGRGPSGRGAASNRRRAIAGPARQCLCGNDDGACHSAPCPDGLDVRPPATAIAALAARSRLPAIYYQREHVDAGGLMSYRANLADMFRHVGTHVDKIRRGARPRDIPME